jgi:3-oxoadipate enol-lactonase
MPLIQPKDQPLYYELAPCTGNARAPYLVLSNSLGADLNMWQPQMAVFRQSFHVLRYDPRGHGRTPVAAAPITLADLACDVLDLLDALKIERAHFCGLSMGGQVALWLGIHAAARLERLVVCNSAARIGSDEIWNGRIEAVRAGGIAAIAEGVIGRWFTARFQLAHPESIAAMKRVLLATAPEGYIAACAALRDTDLREESSEISASTLVVSGTHDQSTTLQDAFFLSEHVRAAHYVELDAAHISNIEQAAQFTSAVDGFLRGGE